MARSDEHLEDAFLDRVAGRLIEDPPVVLRRVVPADGPALRAFYMAERAPEFPGLPDALLATLLDGQYRAREIGYAHAFPALTTFVMTEADALVGLIAVAPDPANTHDLRIVDVRVGGSRCRLGLGRAAIGRTEAAARAAGFEGVVLQVAPDNIGARRLYERLGFTADGTGADGSALTMRHSLSPPGSD